MSTPATGLHVCTAAATQRGPSAANGGRRLPMARAISTPLDVRWPDTPAATPPAIDGSDGPSGWQRPPADPESRPQRRARDPGPGIDLHGLAWRRETSPRRTSRVPHTASEPGQHARRTGVGPGEEAAMSERRAAPLIAAKQVIPPVRPGAVARPRLHAPLLGDAARPADRRGRPGRLGQDDAAVPVGPRPGRDPRRRLGVAGRGRRRAGPVLDLRPDRAAARRRRARRRARCGALSAPGLDPVDLALPTLLNELAAARHRYVLVLDDYHVLATPASTRASSSSSPTCPPACGWCIAGRSDPPLPLARLRARGELTEIRAADLGFSVDEAAALLRAVGDTPVDAAAARPLCASAPRAGPPGCSSRR